MDYSNVGWGRGYNGNGVNLELFSLFVTIPGISFTDHLKNSGWCRSDSEVRGGRPGGDQLHVPELVHLLAQVRTRDCPDVDAGKLHFDSRRCLALEMFPTQFLLLRN